MTCLSSRFRLPLLRHLRLCEKCGHQKTRWSPRESKIDIRLSWQSVLGTDCRGYLSQALVSFKKYMPSSSFLLQGKHLPFTPSPLRSIFFTYLWSFRWPNYIVTLPRYFSFRLPHLDINTGHLSDELDKKINHSFQINSLLKMILDWQLPVSI